VTYASPAIPAASRFATSACVTYATATPLAAPKLALSSAPRNATLPSGSSVKSLQSSV
jgi:hypothetical protein